MQYAMRHADPRTTMRYDMAKTNLDRHAAHAVAAYLAGMSTGSGANLAPWSNGTGITRRSRGQFSGAACRVIPAHCVSRSN